MSLAARSDWRETVATAVIGVGIVIALAAAAAWAYFVWHIDWVHDLGSSSTPRKNWHFGLAMLLYGTPLVFGGIVIVANQIAEGLKLPAQPVPSEKPVSVDLADAWSRCQSENPDVAIPACSAVILSPEATIAQLVLALVNRGVAFQTRRQYDSAIADYDEAIRLNPDQAEALFNRGNLRLFKGDKTGGDADIARAIAVNPSLGERAN